jgi:hypothetical protein
VTTQDPPPLVPIWTVREMLEKVERRLEEVENQVDQMRSKMNIAIGAITVLGVTGVVNLITNIIQTPGVVK